MLLFSGDLFKMFGNPNLIKYARQIDYVSIHGQPNNFEIYTYDF